MTRRTIFTDADDRTFYRLCNRCNAAWSNVSKCQQCGGVEFRLKWIRKQGQRRLFK